MHYSQYLGTTTATINRLWNIIRTHMCCKISFVWSRDPNGRNKMHKQSQSIKFSIKCALKFFKTTYKVQVRLFYLKPIKGFNFISPFQIFCNKIPPLKQLADFSLFEPFLLHICHCNPIRS